MAKATVKNRHLNTRRRKNSKATRHPDALDDNGKRPVANFSERKSIEQLAAEQGVNLEGQLERILGAGAHLWASDEEFGEFVKGIPKKAA